MKKKNLLPWAPFYNYNHHDVINIGFYFPRFVLDWESNLFTVEDRLKNNGIVFEITFLAKRARQYNFRSGHSMVEAIPILSPLRFLVDRRRIDICQLINFTIKRVFGWRADFPLRSRAINDNELENRLETAGNSRFKRFTFASVSPRYRLDSINFPSTLAANYRLACKIIVPSLFSPSLSFHTRPYYFTIINAACFSSRPFFSPPLNSLNAFRCDGLIESFLQITGQRVATMQV